MEEVRNEAEEAGGGLARQRRETVRSAAGSRTPAL
jgi:hypothetical protein